MPQPPLLLFPTHYLGNLVLGLPWVLRVLARDPRAVAVFDAAFGPLLALLPELGGRVLFYPRGELASGRGFSPAAARLLWISPATCGNTGSIA